MSSQKPKNVMLMAAGTGGHIFPALAVGQQLQAEGVNVSWLATKAGMEHKLVPPSGIPLYPIDIQGIRGNGVRRLLQAPFKILAATISAMRIMKQLKIDAVIGFGGYVAGPGGIAARLLGIPVFIHEQNALAGMTNRYLSKIATGVFQAFPTAFPASPKVLTTGNPVREVICQVAPPTIRMKDRASDPSGLNVLVVGGSLGAQALNTHVPEALSLLAKQTNLPIQVVHQCGQAQLALAERNYQTHANALLTSKVVPFVEDMATAYGTADVVICRAGALTVSEIAMVGVSAVFIPLPSAVDDHQTMNARFLSDQGAGILCPQSQLNAQSLAEKLLPLMNRDTNLIMAIKAREHAEPEATQKVVDAVLLALA